MNSMAGCPIHSRSVPMGGNRNSTNARTAPAARLAGDGFLFERALHNVRRAGKSLGAGETVNLGNLALAGGDVDAHGSLRLAKFRQEGYSPLHRWVSAQVIE